MKYFQTPFWILWDFMEFYGYVNEYLLPSIQDHNEIYCSRQTQDFFFFFAIIVHKFHLHYYFITKINIIQIIQIVDLINENWFLEINGNFITTKVFLGTFLGFLQEKWICGKFFKKFFSFFLGKNIKKNYF